MIIKCILFAVYYFIKRQLSYYLYYIIVTLKCISCFIYCCSINFVVLDVLHYRNIKLYLTRYLLLR